MNVQSSINVFFFYTAYLTSVVISMSGAPGLSFPILAVILFVTAAPGWIVLTCPVVGFPFAKARMITKLMLLSSNLPARPNKGGLAKVAFCFNVCVCLPGRAAFPYSVLGLPPTHALTRAKIMLVDKGRFALELLLALVAVKNFVPLTPNYMTAFATAGYRSLSFKPIRFYVKGLFAGWAFNSNHSEIVQCFCGYVKRFGSGTTIVAAHQADGGQRGGLGIERLPKYVSVCLERFAQLGLEPKRANV